MKYDTHKITTGTRRAWRDADPWKLTAATQHRPALTIIQTTEGSVYGTNRETAPEAEARLVEAGYLVQRLGNLVRMVCLVERRVGV